MPVPQVFRAVRRGTAALNVLDLVEVAGQFAGCEALARRRARSPRARRVAAARGSRHHRWRPEVGLYRGQGREPSRARHRAPLGFP